MISTEDFLNNIENLNSKIRKGEIDDQDLVIGSLDVENLYGSINTKKASEICRKKVLKSPMKFSNINWRWALIYLALTLSAHERVEQKLQQVMPKRLVPKNSPPTVLTAEVDEKRERWHYPTPPEKLDDQQKRKIMGAVIGKMVEIVFSTHYYEWNGKIYVQTGGCPTGLRPSGPVSRVLTEDWRDEMLELAEKMTSLAIINPVLFSPLTFHLLKKYVDDTISASNKLKEGVFWDPSTKCMMWNHEKAKSDNRDIESRTMEEIGTMASSIHGCLNFTWDSPSRNKCGKMPVLDTQLWLGEESREARVHPEINNVATKTRIGNLKNVVLFMFFKKPMAIMLNN